MKHAKRYFSLTVIFEDYDKVNDGGNCLFALEPHDVLPVSIFWASDYLEVLPKHRNLGCMTGILFKIPILKHIYTWMSATDVSRKFVEKLLAKGYSLTINPGGVKEVAELVNEDVRTLILKPRLNFTKLAMRSGVPIVPVYTFGQDKCYDFFISKDKTLVDIGRKVGVLPMYFSGLFGIPFGPPKPVPLTVVVGSPIYVPQMDDPSDEDTKLHHDRFVQAVENLYNNNKSKYGNSSNVITRFSTW